MTACEAKLPLRRCRATLAVTHSTLAFSCHPFLPLALLFLQTHKLNNRLVWLQRRVPSNSWGLTGVVFHPSLHFWTLETPLAAFSCASLAPTTASFGSVVAQDGRGRDGNLQPLEFW